MDICPKCKTWKLASDDIVCSWCGHRLVGVEAKLARSRFLSSEIAPPVTLALSNKSQSTQITVQSLEVDPAGKPWITIDGRKTPFVLAGDSSEELTLHVDSASLPPESYHTGFIIIRTNVGMEKLILEVVPPPKVLISGYSGNEQRKSCVFDIILDDRSQERNLVRIAAVQGVAEIEGIRIEEDCIAVRLPGDARFPIILDSRKSAYLDVFLDVDETALARKSTTLPAEYNAVLKVELPDFAHEERLMFKCWKPPALWIQEEEVFRIEAWPDERREFVLTLQNSVPGRPETGLGFAPLQVSKVEIQEPGGGPCEWLQPCADLLEPFSIPGGKSRCIKFTFETDATGKSEGKRLGIGRYAFIVVLTTNLKPVTYRARFEVMVSPIREFEGILAIDFGSSNTCCAVLEDSDTGYKLVAVDSPLYNVNPQTAPTVIQYLSPGEGGGDRIRIGAEVDTLELSAKVIRSTARSLKRRLGTPDPFELCFYDLPEEVVNYPAKQVVGDYLRQVRAAADRDRPGFRFRRLVITHPSRFTLRQIMELKEAVQYAFEECEIRLLPEPVAAALELIMKPEMLGQENYRLGVFDFGGGTTDLSLLEVVNERSHGFTEVRARQINATGRWFGGEDLTRFVYERSMMRCHEIATTDYKGQALNFDPLTATEGNQRLVAVENTGRLMQWAEYCKLLLFQHGDDWAATGTHFPANTPGYLFPRLHLTLRGDSGFHARDFLPNQISPRREELEGFLRSGLESLAGDLATLVSRSRAGKLDYLCLSGKSSAIPLVREVLSTQFPEAEIRLAAEPKECVVQGACISYQASFGTSVFLDFEDTGFVQTTSRIGIADLLAGRFCEILGAGVPVGKEGTKGYYEKFPLRRDARILLLENTSLNDDLKGNKDITPIATFKVDPSFTRFTNNRAIPARLEVTLSQDLTPTLAAYMSDAGPVPLVLEQNQRQQGVGR